MGVMKEFAVERSEDCDGAERRSGREIAEAMCGVGGGSGEREVEECGEKGGEEWMEAMDGGKGVEWRSALERFEQGEAEE